MTFMSTTHPRHESRLAPHGPAILIGILALLAVACGDGGGSAMVTVPPPGGVYEADFTGDETALTLDHTAVLQLEPVGTHAGDTHGFEGIDAIPYVFDRPTRLTLDVGDEMADPVRLVLRDSGGDERARVSSLTEQATVRLRPGRYTLEVHHPFAGNGAAPVLAVFVQAIAAPAGGAASLTAATDDSATVRAGKDCVGCNVRGERMTCSLRGIRGRIDVDGHPVEVSSPLVGRHNVENMLCAAGAATALGMAPEAIAAGIASLACVPGRLERVHGRGDRFVYVDYSHTPDALENALTALRALSSGRIVCVLGCGGDRDRTKRPIMGAIAARLSDLAVVTSDNPRSEDPRAIIEEILPGVRAQGLAEVDPEKLAAVPAGKTFAAEPDRRRAIEAGIRAAQPGDMVLIAGKGHETYQVIGNRTIHFDDREQAARVLAELEGTN